MTVFMYLKPLSSLAQNWLAKLMQAVLLAAANLLTGSLESVVLIAILVIADLLSGLIAAYKSGAGIRARNLRQTGIKTIEYTVLMAAATAVANGFLWLAWLAEVVAFYIVVTEFWSVLENLSRTSSRIQKIATPIVRLLHERSPHSIPEDS